MLSTHDRPHPDFVLIEGDFPIFIKRGFLNSNFQSKLMNIFKDSELFRIKCKADS